MVTVMIVPITRTLQDMIILPVLVGVVFRRGISGTETRISTKPRTRHLLIAPGSKPRAILPPPHHGNLLDQIFIPRTVLPLAPQLLLPATLLHGLLWGLVEINHPLQPPRLRVLEGAVGGIAESQAKRIAREIRVQKVLMYRWVGASTKEVS